MRGWACKEGGLSPGKASYHLGALGPPGLSYVGPSGQLWVPPPVVVSLWGTVSLVLGHSGTGVVTHWDAGSLRPLGPPIPWTPLVPLDPAWSLHSHVVARALPLWPLYSGGEAVPEDPGGCQSWNCGGYRQGQDPVGGCPAVFQDLDMWARPFPGASGLRSHHSRAHSQQPMEVPWGPRVVGGFHGPCILPSGGQEGR